MLPLAALTGRRLLEKSNFGHFTRGWQGVKLAFLSGTSLSRPSRGPEPRKSASLRQSEPEAPSLVEIRAASAHLHAKFWTTSVSDLGPVDPHLCGTPCRADPPGTPKRHLRRCPLVDRILSASLRNSSDDCEINRRTPVSGATYVRKDVQKVIVKGLLCLGRACAGICPMAWGSG